MARLGAKKKPIGIDIVRVRVSLTLTLTVVPVSQFSVVPLAMGENDCANYADPEILYSM
jgi:hypothetical protein